MCHTLIFVLNKKKYFLHFLDLFFVIFSTLPSIQTIKVIDLIFFQWAGLEKYIDSDPPAFIGLKYLRDKVRNINSLKLFQEIDKM